MQHSIPVSIDQGKCTGCGLCVDICPDRTLSLDDKAHVTGQKCLVCGHCLAVCPAEAISIEQAMQSLNFATFEEKMEPLAFGKGDTAELVRLMRSRRSCRSYTEQEVPREILEDLVKVGTTAPSGTNSQKWTFTILPHRRAVVKLGDLVGGYFKKLNKLAANPLLRGGLKLIGKPSLANYYNRYYRTIGTGLKEWEEQGIDRLFHGATAAIVVGAGPGASCPMEDGMLATQNILLAAHTMGLGSCLIGFAVAAMEKENSIKTVIGIPGQEPVYAVIALGYPAVKYQRLTVRKDAAPRWSHG